MVLEPRHFEDLAGDKPDDRLSARELLRSFEALLENEALTRTVLIDALARKADGVLLLRREGTIEFINITARNILRGNDGLAFVDGRFVTARLPETERLHRSISRLISFPINSDDLTRSRVLVTRPSGKAPYIVCISPAPGAAAIRGDRCVVHIFDLAAQAALSKDVACSIFGLSDREGDIAVELTRGGNLRVAATRAGMALNTARNHMRSVFSKCRVHSQMELSRILTKLV